MRIQRFADHEPMPWKNGRGTSYEVARSGGDVWAWRVAIAPVVEDGPFSELPGVDRWLVVIEEPALEMSIDGVLHVARRAEVVSFAGESTVVARLPDGATRDLGLMVRRGRATGSMEVVQKGPVTGRIIVAIDQSTVVVAGTTSVLEPGDALIADEPCSLDVLVGPVCVIGVEP